MQFQRYGLYRLIDYPWSQGVQITEVPLYCKALACIDINACHLTQHSVYYTSINVVPVDSELYIKE